MIDKTIRLFIKGNSENRIHPYLYNNNVDLWLMGCIYQGVMMFDDNLKLTNRLTEYVKNNSEFTKFIIKLKDDLFWNDGTKITINDYKFSLETLLHPAAPRNIGRYFMNIVGATEYKKGLSDVINGIKTNNELEFEIALDKPDPFFNQRLLIPIIPQHVFSKIEPISLFKNEYSDKYIGCGPYKLISKESDKFTFKRNESFHLGCPNIRNMIIETGDSEKLIYGIKNNLIDFAEISYEDISNLDGDLQDYVLYQFEKPLINFIIINHNNEFLKNKFVRQAIAYAIDKEQIKRSVYQGYAEPIEQYYSSILKNYKVKDLNKYKFNINKSVEVIDGIIPNGESITLKLGIDRLNKEHKIMARIIKDNLSKINFKVEIIEYENADSWQQDFLNDELDLFIFDYKHLICPDPSNIFSKNSGLIKLTKWDSPENFNLVNSCRNANNDQIAVFQDWSRFINEELPVVFLFSPYEIQIINKRISNLKPSPRGLLWNIHELLIKK